MYYFCLEADFEPHCIDKCLLKNIIIKINIKILQMLTNINEIQSMKLLRAETSVRHYILNEHYLLMQ